jgi:hypothetical protein
MLTAFSRRGLKPWEQLLIDTYPSIYLTPNPEIWSINHPLLTTIDPCERCNLRYGFEMCAGWIGLVEKYSRTAVGLVTALHSSKIQPDARVSSFVIKEKLGRLVIQGHDNLVEPFQTLFFAYRGWIEDRSVHICERCGRPGSLRTLGLLKITLCEAEYQSGLRRMAGLRSDFDG